MKEKNIIIGLLSGNNNIFVDTDKKYSLLSIEHAKNMKKVKCLFFYDKEDAEFFNIAKSF